MMWPRLTADTKRHEGFRAKAYRDTVGKLTIGYGLNLDEGIDEEEAEWLLKHRLEKAASWGPKLFTKFEELDDVRQEVIVNMIYNMGPGRVAKFHKMRAAVDLWHFDEAAAEMLESLWATQVGQRAKELAERMRTGMVV